MNGEKNAKCKVQSAKCKTCLADASQTGAKYKLKNTNKKPTKGETKDEDKKAVEKNELEQNDHCRAQPGPRR